MLKIFYSALCAPNILQMHCSCDLGPPIKVSPCGPSYSRLCGLGAEAEGFVAMAWGNSPDGKLATPHTLAVSPLTHSPFPTMTTDGQTCPFPFDPTCECCQVWWILIRNELEPNSHPSIPELPYVWCSTSACWFNYDFAFPKGTGIKPCPLH